MRPVSALPRLFGKQPHAGARGASSPAVLAEQIELMGLTLGLDGGAASHGVSPVLVASLSLLRPKPEHSMKAVSPRLPRWRAIFQCR